MERTVVSLLLAAMLLGGQTAKAQSEGGLLLGVEAEKTLGKDLSLNVEAGFRSRNDFRTADRWSGSVGAEYKLAKWLKADASYTFLYDNNREKLTNNYWRPSYWDTRHRLNASLTGSYKVGNMVRLSLRERWQYTYRPEKTTQRWDFDNECWEDKVVAGKAKHQLRSRLQIEYDKKKALLTPYANVELFNSLGIESVRYTVGTDIRLTKQHSLQVYYRFKNTRNVDEDDYDPDMHYLGFGYKFKL